MATLDTVGDGVGPTTVRPGLRHIRDRMQLGLYWGRCLAVDDSSDWDVSTPEQLDLSDPALVATAVAEMDLAVSRWGAQLIGLDEFDTKNTPALGPAWLRLLQGRYPHAMLVTEQALPDYLHVIAPTFITETDDPGTVDRPFWLQQYLNPGHECVLQILDLPFGVSENQRAHQLLDMGFSPLAIWSTTLDTSLRATPRWMELGEASIPCFRSGILTCWQCG
ncbi:MAG: hypothetical protein AB7K52_11230 [Phycisphaerales bacterium]